MNMELVQLTGLFAEPVLQVSGRAISLGEVLAAAGVLLAVLLCLVTLLRRRRETARVTHEAAQLAKQQERAREAEARLAQVMANQNELSGRMGAMADLFGSRQADMMRLVDDRLANMTGRIGQSIEQTTKTTTENLTKLQERLAVIDHAQNNITQLTGQVVELQNILSNKQTRGAFGEARMQAIIQDGLPHDAYEFQPTLSNNSRPDCLIRMPNGTPSLVVDAKFPLESWSAIQAAETPEAGRRAQAAFRRDIEVHIKSIAEKYLIKGETQDTAFMFVPSESVFAEIHEHYEALVQKAHRARVVIVSPSLLMLSIQVIQSVLKDARMREQAHLIQAEVAQLMDDVGRLDDRVRKLHSHFGQAQKDIELITTSAGKVTKRGNRITDLDFSNQPIAEPDSPKLRAVE